MLSERSRWRKYDGNTEKPKVPAKSPTTKKYTLKTNNLSKGMNEQQLFKEDDLLGDIDKYMDNKPKITTSRTVQDDDLSRVAALQNIRNSLEAKAQISGSIPSSRRSSRSNSTKSTRNQSPTPPKLSLPENAASAGMKKSLFKCLTR